MRRFESAILFLVCVATNLMAAETTAPVVGQPIPDFSLKDYRGKSYSLSELDSSRLIVLAVLGTECPLAKQYAVKLQKLADGYRERGVVIIGVDANRQDSLEDIAAFAKHNSLSFPILKDPNHQLVDSLQATRTPEVFVLDSHKTVRYRGRVDDQFAIGGRSRSNPTRDDLKQAVDELLDGKPVSVPETTAIGCLIGRSREPQANSPVTYSRQISRIFQQNCVECHRPGEIGPFSLTDYSEAAGWADTIVEVTQAKRMPPWHASPEHGHFANEKRLTAEELDLLKQWAAAGAPQGDPADLPSPRSYTSGWQLPREPDHVVYMSEKPFHVPEDGVVRYQFFSVDAGIAEDKWLAGAEIIPGNRAVVHHVIVFLTTNGKVVDEDRQMVTAYVPGLRVVPYPKGMAKRIPAGSKFIFQMHYTPNGVAADDRTKIGLIFANPDEITHEVRTASAGNRKFKIEPFKDDQTFESRTVTSPIEVQLLSMSPHMHLRGKSFRYELTFLDGKKETILDVPHYDFNWQTAYILNEPRKVPFGTKLQAFATYDNSPNNLANPDPSKTVTWGDQSWDEMLLGYFDIAIPAELAGTAKKSAGPLGEIKEGLLAVKKLFETFDKNKDGVISRDEVGPAQKALFDKIDTDNNGTVTEQELLTGLPEIRKATRQ